MQRLWILLLIYWSTLIDVGSLEEVFGWFLLIVYLATSIFYPSLSFSLSVLWVEKVVVYCIVLETHSSALSQFCLPCFNSGRPSQSQTLAKMQNISKSLWVKKIAKDIRRFTHTVNCLVHIIFLPFLWLLQILLLTTTS